MEAVGPIKGDAPESLEAKVLANLRAPGKGFYLLVVVLLALVAWGAFAYALQLRTGLFVTGMRDRIMWGLYIAIFVFFIGASMGGTFISAILRVTGAAWRLPIMRSAELITVVALMMAGVFIVFDIGRPDRLHHLFLFGHWTSPLIWDVYGLSTYLVGSMMYLYMALIPDLALCRDRAGEGVARPLRWFFHVFSLGWRGDPGQRRLLQQSLQTMTILIIPVAVMMHTVTSWVFAMTLREPWDSALFGIYFVGGAVYSGVGIVILLSAVLRRVFHLEDLITLDHFVKLGYLLAAFAALMLFFNVSEYVTHAYKLKGHMSVHIHSIFLGDLSPLFWTYLLGGTLLPLAMMLLLPVVRRIGWVVVAAVLVNVGMVLERYLIVVGGLDDPLNPYPSPSYAPTWVEWSLLAAGFAGFVLIIALILRLVPSVPISELVESHEDNA